MAHKLLIEKKAVLKDKTVAVQSNQVAVDFPREGSTIEGPYYSIRVASALAEMVDICINQGDWQPCRNASGYWWYDWSGFDAGEHQIVARARVNGQTEVSKPRTFMVP